MVLYDWTLLPKSFIYFFPFFWASVDLIPVLFILLGLSWVCLLCLLHFLLLEICSRVLWQFRLPKVFSFYCYFLGWQPGIQESAADWDEDWDKFEDEGMQK